MQVLVKAGADLEAKNSQGLTALQVGCEYFRVMIHEGCVDGWEGGTPQARPVHCLHAVEAITE